MITYHLRGRTTHTRVGENELAKNVVAVRRDSTEEDDSDESRLREQEAKWIVRNLNRRQ